MNRADLVEKVAATLNLSKKDATAAIDAFPLSSPVRDDVTTLIKSLFPTAKQIIISEQIDPKVIGGVRLELANQQLDLSIRSKLNRFKQLTVATGGVK